MKNKIAEIIATWFGCGKSPKAPGTVGSLGALPVIWLLSHYHADVFAMLILALFLFFIGVWATDVMIKKSAVKDPSFVVIDEVVGQMISFALIWPMLGHQHAWGFYVFAFVLFRFFDIKKMGPVRFLIKKFAMLGGLCLMMFLPVFLPPPFFISGRFCLFVKLITA